jgi:hypothetical protein
MYAVPGGTYLFLNTFTPITDCSLEPGSMPITMLLILVMASENGVCGLGLD